MRRSIISLAVLLTAASPVLAEDDLGTLTLFGPGPTDQHLVTIQSMFLQIPPRPGTGGGDDSEQLRTITVTSQIAAPDPALISWIIGPDTKRHVVMELNDRPDGTGTSTYDIENGQATGLTVGYGSRGSGQQTLTILVEHLKINGQPVY